MFYPYSNTLHPYYSQYSSMIWLNLKAHSFIDRFYTFFPFSFPIFSTFQRSCVSGNSHIFEEPKLSNIKQQLTFFQNWHCWLFWITFHQLKVGWECRGILTAALNALYTLIFNSELLADERVKLLEEVKGEEGLIFKIADLYNLLKSKM